MIIKTSDGEIMIDGVDVAKCDEYYADGLCLTGVGSTVCKNNPNCHYKLYKRKEQECEELKKSVRSNKDKRKRAIEKYLKLKEFTNKEFQELKAEKKEVNDFLTDIASYISYNGELPTNLNEVRICIKDICKANQILDKNAKLYRQTLTEIKEIAEKVLKECNNCDQYSCYGCPDENKDELAKQILQKCEVVDDN